MFKTMATIIAFLISLGLITTPGNFRDSKGNNTYYKPQPKIVVDDNDGW